MPSQLQTAKTLFLVSGILNIIMLLGWSGGSIIGGFFTCGAGCLFIFLPVINIVVCILDFIAYDKLNSLNKTGTFKTIQLTAILEIVSILSGNIVSFVFGIIILNYISSPDVTTYLKEKGIY